MIDLTEITDKVARSYWEKLPDRPPYDTLEPQEKVGLKQALMPLIHETATLTEAAVREQIATQLEIKRAEARENHRITGSGYDDGLADALGDALNIVEGGQ